MSVYILKNSSKQFTLPLIDNEGNSYTSQPGSVKVFNDSPELGSIEFSDTTLKGTINSLDVTGTLNYHFEAVTIGGKKLAGPDKVFIVDELPKEDANQIVALYI